MPLEQQQHALHRLALSSSSPRSPLSSATTVIVCSPRRSIVAARGAEELRGPPRDFLCSITQVSGERRFSLRSSTLLGMQDTQGLGIHSHLMLPLPAQDLMFDPVVAVDGHSYERT